jgi:hypothetical protein
MVGGRGLNTPAWTEETFALVREGIRLSNEAYVEHLSRDWDSLIDKRAVELGEPHSKLEPCNLNVVIFHVKIPPDAGVIKAPDIRSLDHDKFDYETLIQLNIKIALKTNPRARVLLLTDETFLHELQPHSRLNISRLPFNAREPMFERVVMMAAYVRSRLFRQPTVFLDSDAFLLRPVHNLFANHFDVGLTHRNIVGQMPINEGVIFVNNLNPHNVIQVFNTYVASYLAIERDPSLAKLYSNLRRWRGGQLALNSIAQGGQAYMSGLSNRSDPDKGPKIVYLPCSSYNLSQISEEEVTPSLPKRAAVLHLKGPRKIWLSNLKESVLS